jgi:hypothetical protein
LTPEQAKGSENLTDNQIVVLAFATAGSYLVVSAENKKATGSNKK